MEAEPATEQWVGLSVHHTPCSVPSSGIPLHISDFKTGSKSSALLCVCVCSCVHICKPLYVDWRLKVQWFSLWSYSQLAGHMRSERKAEKWNYVCVRSRAYFVNFISSGKASNTYRPKREGDAGSKEAWSLGSSPSVGSVPRWQPGCTDYTLTQLQPKRIFFMADAYNCHTRKSTVKCHLGASVSGSWFRSASSYWICWKIGASSEKTLIIPHQLYRMLHQWSVMLYTFMCIYQFNKHVATNSQREASVQFQTSCSSQLHHWAALWGTSGAEYKLPGHLPAQEAKLPLLTRPKKSKMSRLDVDDFIQQNRAVAEQVETFRGYWESEKHWEPRREFILRNITDFEEQQLDHLVSLSMVWANNVFMGCRYVNKPSFDDLWC